MAKPHTRIPLVRNRIEKFKKRRPDWKTDYAKVERGHVKEIVCFICGTIIFNEREVDKRENKIIVKSLPNDSFAKLDLELSNGSRMNPMVCKKCKKKVESQIDNDEQLKEDIMDAMIDAWTVSNERNGFNKKEQEKTLKPLLNLKVKGKRHK